LAGVIKIDQRTTADVNQKKASMAYGGGPNDSLSALMNKRKPINNQSSSNTSNGNISFATVQDIYTKALQSINNKENSHYTKEEKQILKETDDEFKRRGFYKRIFPTYDFLYYK
jgi:hypothetical protein